MCETIYLSIYPFCTLTTLALYAGGGEASSVKAWHINVDKLTPHRGGGSAQITHVSRTFQPTAHIEARPIRRSTGTMEKVSECTTHQGGRQPPSRMRAKSYAQMQGASSW